MSLLSDFVKAAHGQAQFVIGAEKISIGGGTEIDAIVNAVTYSSEAEDSGFAPMATHTAVIAYAAFAAAYTSPAKSYVGRRMTRASENFRITDVSVSVHHVVLTLSTITRS